MKLTDLWISAVVRCAPPGNKPTPEELRNCAPWLDQEMKLLTDLRVVVCLGRIAFDGLLAHETRMGNAEDARRFCFCAWSGIQVAERTDRDRQLSSVAAEHEHRQADAGDAAQGLQARAETGRFVMNGHGSLMLCAGERSEDGYVGERDFEGCESG